MNGTRVERKGKNRGIVEAREMALSELVGMERNAKEHDIGGIDVSMERYGFLQRIAWNAITERVIGGNGRVEALRGMKARGEGAPEGVRVEVGSGEWMVPVDVVEVLVEDQAGAAIALNRLVEQGGWDELELSRILADLSARDGVDGLEGTGFDGDDLDALLRDIGRSGKDIEDIREGSLDTQDGIVDEKAEEEIAERAGQEYGVVDGDVFLIGGHVLVCGDCRESKSWEFGMAALKTTEKAAGIFTSPPYAWRRDHEYEGVPTQEYVSWWEAVQERAQEWIAEDGSLFVNLKAHVEDGARTTYVMELVLAMVKQWGWSFVEEFCWERVGIPGRWRNRFRNSFEPIYQFGRQPYIQFYPKNLEEGSGHIGRELGTTRKNINNRDWYHTVGPTGDVAYEHARPSNRLSIYGSVGGLGHPAAFPVELPFFFMRAFSRAGDIWIDPFGGAASTAVAAQRCGRRSLCIDKTPKYIATSLARLERELGKTAVKV